MKPDHDIMTTSIRVENGTAGAYRLLKKASGELVLQGCYRWTNGMDAGYDWRDIPTVEETATNDSTS